MITSKEDIIVNKMKYICGIQYVITAILVLSYLFAGTN